MSTSRKKTYKKRKQQAHTTQKVSPNVKTMSKTEQFLNNWLWLITLVIIVALTVMLVIFVPMCDSCTACSNMAESCAAEENVDDAVTSEPFDVTSYTDQFAAPAVGEEVAVFETSMGVIKMRLFADAAPKSVENFKTHIKNGYYNGVTFHRVINDFMIQGGDPTGIGNGGESIWGGDFEDEYENGYYNFRGALSMANTGDPNTNSSQFFIVQRDDVLETVEQLVGGGLPEWVAKKYADVGGYPMGDHELYEATGYNGHTVFGQVYEGMDVVDAIAAVEVDGNSKPLSDVVITKAYLETVA